MAMVKLATTPFLVLFTSLYLSACGSVETKVNVIATKVLNSNFIVEGRRTLVLYSVYNVGETDVVNVKLSDDSLMSGPFEMEVEPVFVWERITARTNVSVGIEVVPKEGGVTVNLTHATLTYTKDGDNDRRKLLTNHLGEVKIISSNQYHRGHSHHLLEWILFLCLLAPFFLLPYKNWLVSCNQYQVGQKERKHGKAD